MRLGETAEVVLGVEEGDVDAGAEEARGEGEHGVDVALQRPGEHQHVHRRHVRWPLLHRPVLLLLTAARQVRSAKYNSASAGGFNF